MTTATERPLQDQNLGTDVPSVPEGPPYRWALVAGGLVGLLYAITLAPTTNFWDTSEYIATGHMMGIPIRRGTRCSWCSPVPGTYSWRH